ncbi:MAG TPA: TIGR02611 family protein [Jatrophihabitans sp.]|nr:TIGR02611 family protein [Jatrophihabitans sp.]
MSEESGRSAELRVVEPDQASPPQWLRPARSWVHRQPAGPLIWKIAISVLGAGIVGLGLLLIPLPGPGWAVVFLGVAVWATEFVWAQRLLRRGRRLLREWTGWLARQSLAVRGLAGLLGLAVLAGLGYLGWRFLR